MNRFRARSAAMTILGALLISSVGPASPASADPGDVDESFGDGGFVQVASPLEKFPYVARNSVDSTEENGAWLTFEATAEDGRDHVARLVRLTEDGSFDRSFSRNGIRRLSTARTAPPLGLSNGDVVVVGFGQNRRGRDETVAVRYHADGSLDRSFGWRGETTRKIRNIGSIRADLTAEGGVLHCSTTPAGSRTTILRTDPDGDQDDDFNTGGVAIFWNEIRGQVIDCRESADGGALIALRGNDKIQLMRLTPDGVLDTTFGDRGFLVLENFPGVSSCTEAWMLRDGRTMIGCDVSNGETSDMLLVRVDAEGVPDDSFDEDGFLEAPSVGEGTFAAYGDVVLEPDGGFWLAGLNYRGGFDYGGSFVMRRAADGSPVVGYGDGGVATFDGTQAEFPVGLAIDGEGRALVASVSQDIGYVQHGELARLEG